MSQKTRRRLLHRLMTAAVPPTFYLEIGSVQFLAAFDFDVFGGGIIVAHEQAADVVALPLKR